MHGVTFPQNSNSMLTVTPHASAWAPGAPEGPIGPAVAAPCSKYIVQSWHSINAWNNDDICTTDVFDCSTNPANIT